MDRDPIVSTSNNFDAVNEKDDLGIFYGSESGISSIKRTGATGDGVQSMTQDRTILEDDTNLVVTNNPSGSSAFDTVAEAKGIIAQSINSVEDGADRLAQITYGLDAQTGNTDAYVIAANLGSASPTDNLGSDDTFSVASVARLVGVDDGTMDISKNSALVKTDNLS